MPETRLAKTRPSLPEGYQFGDARPCANGVHRVDGEGCACGLWTRDGTGWSTPPIAISGIVWWCIPGFTTNAIEGDHA